MYWVLYTMNFALLHDAFSLVFKKILLDNFFPMQFIELESIHPFDLFISFLRAGWELLLGLI